MTAEVSTKTPKQLEAKPIDEKFSGYTLDELRYQRALVTLQKEFCKEKFMASIHNITTDSPLTKIKNGKSGFLMQSGIWSKIFRSLNYVDYAIMGFSLFKTAKSIFRLFKRK